MDYEIIDCHIHLRQGAKALAPMARQVARWGQAATTAQSLEGGYRPDSQSQNAMCMAFKREYPQMYAFAGLNHQMGDFAAQAKALWAAGCDGFKMIEGKPNASKRWGIRLDDAAYLPFYEFCQQAGATLLLHTADPAEFWDINLISQEAIDNGWYYDETFPKKEELLEQAISVIEKFPRMNVILAHFFFQSGDFDRLAAWLDRYPNMYVDVTPGVEMYEDFSADTARTAAFFEKYQDRILFGTDNQDAHTEEDNAEADRLTETVVRYFTTTDEVDIWDMHLRGVPLSAGAREKLFSGNFKRLAPHRPLDEKKAAAYFHAMLDNPSLELTPDERETIETLWPRA